MLNHYKQINMKTIYNCGHHAIEVAAYSLSVPPELPCVICHSAAKLEQDDDEGEPVFTVGNQYDGYVYSPYTPADPALFPLVLQRKCKTSAAVFIKGDRFREMDYSGGNGNGKYECIDGRILICDKDFFEPNPPMPGGESDVKVDMLGETFTFKPVDIPEVDLSRELSTKFAQRDRKSFTTSKHVPLREEDDLPY